MNKKFLSTTLAFTIGFSSLGVAAPAVLQPIEVSAAATNSYNNQQQVEQTADKIIALGKSLIGKATYSNTEYKPTAPYKFSCASFLMYIFEKNGADLATYNEDSMMKQGTYVARKDLQKGDLVFFRSKTTGTDPDHVGIYIGDNKLLHMADSKQNIVISDMNSKPYYTESYLTARRVLPTLLSANPATVGDKIVDQAYSLKDKVTMGSVNNEASLRFTGGGFVKYVYDKQGVSLNTTKLSELMTKGTTVSRASLKKGDLVFFNSSVGSKTPSLVAIYAGDHRLIIPSSSGVTTRVMMVDYYNEHYITAKRVISSSSSSGNTDSNTSTPQTTTADKIISTANSLVGKAKFGYSYNESTLTFTSAGFTYYVFNKHGINLKSKLASSQATVGTAVQKANLQKGDILYFSINNGGKDIKQTGIYIGGNQFITLPTSGTAVKQSLSSTWATKNYVSARRVF
ncbi:C40 family peptidase [Lysinibacillus sp. 54212]|uniref:C40 family peptidase n=1 Tax=Lysinibacillus sp. 54212 TaxID=3119829 RepID=UPI002FCB3F94